MIDLGIKTVDQFFDNGIRTPTNEACGAACSTMILRWMYPDNKMTLLDVVKKTPLVYSVNGTLVKGQQGLTCEQVMALCLKLGIDARLEYMSQISLKQYLDLGRPTICLLNYGVIPLKYRQDTFHGFHFEVCSGYDDNNTFLMCDPDVLQPSSGFGTNIKVPFGVIDYALQASDQTRLCVVVYGKLDAQVDKTVVSATTLNLRIQPTLDSYVQTTIKRGDNVEILSGTPEVANNHTWLRVRYQGEFIGWCVQDLLISSTVSVPPSTPRKLPIGIAYVVQSGDQLNVRISPNITSQSIGKLKALTPVMVLSDDPQKVGNYTWYHITSDTVSGWVVGEFLDTGVSPQNGATDVPKHTNNYIGIHYLNSTQKQGFLDFIKRLHDKGKPLVSVTIVNDFDASNVVKKLSPDTFVLFRTEDGTNPTPEGDPNKAAQDWFNKCLPKIKLAPTANAYQLANEWGSGNVDWLSKFYAALSNIARQSGFVITVGDIAVGNIQDTEIPLLKPMLDVAQHNGHLFNYHQYSCSENGDNDMMCQSDFFVNRWKKWLVGYPNLRIIFGEAANYSANFISVDQTVKNIKALNDNLTQINDGRVTGFNYWTFGDSGGWSRSSIDAALPQIEGYLSSL